jgi:hypothetical protein
LGGIVRAIDDDSCLDEVIDVNVSSASWINEYFYDEFCTFCKGNGRIQKYHGWDKVLAWCVIG